MPSRGGSRKGVVLGRLKKPKEYDALRRKGYSKASAARISNAEAKGSIKGRGGRKKRR